MPQKYIIYFKSSKFTPFYSKTILKKGKKYCKIKAHILYCGTSSSSSNVATPSFDGDGCYTEYKNKQKYKFDNTSDEVVKGVKKGIHMVNVIGAAKFIVQLYYKCDSRYKCSRTKLEKLLTIASLTVMKNGDELFVDKITINQCGTGIPALSNKFLPDLIGGVEDEDGNPISRAMVCNSVEAPSIYKIEETEKVDSKIEKLLEDVFINFGNYKAVELGKKLDEFKCELSVSSDLYDRDIICSTKVHDFFVRNNESLGGNEIYSFIFNYGKTN